MFYVWQKREGKREAGNNRALYFVFLVPRSLLFKKK